MKSLHVGISGFTYVVLGLALSFTSREVVESPVSSSSSSLLLNMEWLEQAWELGSTSQLPPIQTEAPDVHGRYEVLSYVLENCPENCVVYPSEGYFYFKYFAGKRLISGNIRFCDVADGIVHFGYFDEYDRSFLSHGMVKDGVNGMVRSDGNIVTLGYRGLTKSFRLDQSWMNPCVSVVKEGEEAVTGVLDESGYHFTLVYNQQVKQFVFIRNPEKPIPEQRNSFSFGNGVQYHIGLASRFVFMVDGNREILVGVHKDNIVANNFFDGPFDQVPPRLALKDKLEQAYPYVMQRGGIDSHGNFNKIYGNRVAISPYVQYENLNQFCQLSAIAHDFEIRGSPLPYLGHLREEKSSFHLKIQEGVQND